ncbi:MAG: DUF6982 domain-containing protein [Gemmatimonadales bacterium]
MHGHLIVAHLLDGKVLKGTSLDVDPKKPSCHLRPRDGESVEIALADTKALFFVKTETGRPAYNETRTPASGDARLVGTKRVKVRFADSEEIVGLMNRFPPITPYFYMLPIDPTSNNIRILVNRAAVKEMAELDG